MKSILLVAAGGAIGAMLRYVISVLLKQPGAAFPWHTALINLSGCLAIGICYALLATSAQAEFIRTFVMIGILGGFTTFSSFGLETLQLTQAGEWKTAITYVLLSNIGGLSFAAGGYWMFK